MSLWCRSSEWSIHPRLAVGQNKGYALQRPGVRENGALLQLEREIDGGARDAVDMPEPKKPYRAGLTWVVVEVGESTFNIGTGADDPENPIQWEPWRSIVRKGRPETLIHLANRKVVLQEMRRSLIE